MDIITEFSATPVQAGVSVALGNFDGAHRGHRAVIAAARRAGERLNVPLGVVTFEPHPREVFRPDDPPFRLCLGPLKARRLKALGVERMFVAPFSAEMSSLSPEAFAKDVLAARVGARHVAVGEDFRFGAKRAGDALMLKALGRAHGFEVEVVAPVGGDEPFSSSAVRHALREARPEEAARILGDWHRIEGVVEKGHQRGRELQYPTANLSMDRVVRPAYGVYAVRAEVLDGPHTGAYEGVASLGERPTFGGFAPNFETHIFDFSADIYGATLSVSLCAYLRPELKFESVETLIAKMDEDSAQARRVLASLQEPWPKEEQNF